MWYAWALLSTLFGATEYVIDKALVVGRELDLDPLVAVFYRNLLFWAFTALGALLALFGRATFVLSVPMALYALAAILGSLIYDYFLKTHEVSRFQSIGYVFPLLFVFTDRAFFSTQYSLPEFLGISFLLTGGFFFSFNLASETRAVFSLREWAFFVVDFTVWGSGYIIFKGLQLAYGVNEISFYFSAWVLVVAYLLVFLLVGRKYRLIIPTGRKGGFFVKTAVSKLFDFLSAITLLRAIALSSIAKAYSVTAVAPLVLLSLTWICTRFLGWNLKESFEKGAFVLKILGASLFVLGALFLV